MSDGASRDERGADVEATQLLDTDVERSRATGHALLRERFAAARAPATLGRYRLLKTLGAGAAGVVWAAYDPQLDRRVAIKRIDLSGAPRLRLRFVREARAIAQLSHPNVVSIHDVGGERGGRAAPLTAESERAFLVMELVDGVDLALWLSVSERGVDELLRVFRAAGRGLAAAHAMGIVHRDFKPQNVLVGARGEVKVADFGLATDRAQAEDPAREAGSSLERPSVSLVADVTQLTRTGAILGTPAYMPPEQHEGAAVDERGDQFSFCAALFEALYGRRPFAGADLRSLRASVLSGRLDPPLADPRVPPRVRAAVLKGLSRSPDDRHPSMHALLAELEPPARTRTWRWWVALGLPALTLSAGAWLWARAPRCVVAPLWDDARGGALRASFAASGLEGAEGSAARVSAELERWAARWVDARAGGCRDNAAGTWSDALYNRQILCLERRRLKFDALRAAFEDAERETVLAAVDAVESLPTLERCQDASFLLAAVEPPATPALEREVSRLRAALERARATSVSDRPRRGLQRVATLEPEVLATGYAPLEIELNMAYGTLLSSAGQLAAAERALSRAFFDARREGDDESAITSAVELSYLVGARLDRIDEGLRWAEHAAAEVERAGSPIDQARLDVHRGLILELAARYDEAEEAQRAALAILERARGSDSALLIDVWSNLGTLALHGGRVDEALAHYERALALAERVLPPQHFERADLHVGLAQVHVAAGRYDAAERALQRALQLRLAARGADSLEAATVHNELGLVYFGQARYAAARDAFQRSLEIAEGKLAPDHVDLLATLNNLASVTYFLGDFAASERLHRRVLALRRARDPRHPEVAVSLQNVGYVVAGQGRHEEALALYDESRALLVTALGADSPQLARNAINAARSLRALDRLDEALARLEEAARLRAPSGDEPPHPELVTTRIEQARARAAKGLPEEAERALSEALALADRLDPSTPQASEALVAYAEHCVARGRLDEAAALAEQAVSRLEGAGRRELRGRARFVLARAARARATSEDARARARALAEDAREDLRAIGDAGHEARAELERWLVEVSAP
ncbi:MAG: serine/threonine protein kinase [Myxococcales bacterium]|nr:serine/threonine protein kinase [Myxococcales bacterium]